MGYKRGRLYFTTFLQRPTLLSLLYQPSYVSSLQCLSASGLPTPLCSLTMLELGTCKLYFQTPCWLASHESPSTGGTERRLEGGNMKKTLPVPDPGRLLAQARQLWFEPPASFSTRRCLLRGTSSSWPPRSQLKRSVHFLGVLALATVYPH